MNEDSEKRRGLFVDCVPPLKSGASFSVRPSGKVCVYAAMFISACTGSIYLNLYDGCYTLNLR